MIRATALTLAAISAACSSSPADPPAATATVATKAGSVVELTGTVTATRAGKPRTLALHDEVSRDDVVDTGTDGQVTIELAHNNARWTLGPGHHGQVAESVAWSLPKVDQVAEAVAGDTSAAGRHAEKSAVETAASTTVVEHKAPPPTPKPDPTPEPLVGGLGLKGTGPGGGGTGGGIGLGQIGTIGHGAGGGTGGGYGAGGGKLGGDHQVKTPRVVTGDATVSGGLPVEVIRRIVRQHIASLRYCYEVSLQKDPTLHGKVVVKFEITTDGAVQNAAATGIDPEVDACITEKFAKFSFPHPDSLVQVTYPLTFEPAD